MYFDDLTSETIQKEIQRYEDRINTLKALETKISGMSFYECGIRKTDHRLCYFTFTLSGIEAQVDVKVPQSNETYRITLDAFVNDFIAYSSKTRNILPKRYKRG